MILWPFIDIAECPGYLADQYLVAFIKSFQVSGYEAVWTVPEGLYIEYWLSELA